VSNVRFVGFFIISFLFFRNKVLLLYIYYLPWLSGERRINRSHFPDRAGLCINAGQDSSCCREVFRSRTIPWCPSHGCHCRRVYLLYALHLAPREGESSSSTGEALKMGSEILGAHGLNIYVLITQICIKVK